MGNGVATRQVRRTRSGTTATLDDALAMEVPVAFVYDDEPFAVMLASPCDVEDFALGFALTEGVIDHAEELRLEAVEMRLEGIEVRARLAPGRQERVAARSRSLPGRSGCGLCGATALEAALRPPPAVTSQLVIDAATLQRALRALQARQPMNRATGAVHAAAFADRHGELVLTREDIGRHNALDKLVGALARAGIEPASGFAVITSRASYEMVAKAASAGIGLLAAVSAPTALAVDVARRCRLTLVGFARADGHAVYAHPERLREAAP